jgi:hypothetical protein
MSIVAFPHRARAWSAGELQQLLALFQAEAGTGAVSGWAVGATEQGDPQFYLLGPGHECVLCVSRLAQMYVLEDGEGRLIGEAPALASFAEFAHAAVRRGRSLVARVTLAWLTVRLAIEEKLEPIFEESEELLARFAPQIAALV